MRARLPLLCLISAACTPAGPIEEPSGATTASVPVPTPAPPAKPSADATVETGVPCGELGCTQYTDVAQAFQALLRDKPRIVAVGEAHAQKGTETIATATQRFTQTLLPLLVPTASDIVLELLLPDGKCTQEVAKVQKQVEKPVTQTQRDTNQNEFVTLGNKAKELGMRPHVLRPSCEQYQKVAAAGDDGLFPMLELIAGLSAETASLILQRNERTSVDKGVVLYGGAMHNDLQPREGRETFSFGPKLSTSVGGSYVEVDLIVPEYIKDTDSWRAFPWYPHYDRAKHGDKVTVFEIAPKSYALIFAET